MQMVARLSAENTLKTSMHVPAFSRRRVAWHVDVSRESGNTHVALGFHAAKSHNVVPLTMCNVTHKSIFELHAPLLALLNSMKKPGVVAHISLTLAENGVDAVLHLKSPLHKKDVALWAEAPLNIIRLSTSLEQYDYVKIYEKEAPHLTFSEVNVNMPQGAFLQATQSGEQAILNALLSELPKAESVITECFSGLGTYTLPLAALGHRITAYEGAEPMVQALTNAVRQHPKLNIHSESRDLMQRPVPLSALTHTRIMVLNPPRAGAKAQCAEVARSTISHVAYVSCSPKTFERDARLLINAGFRITSLTPIDQFLWTDHLELVAHFSKTGDAIA